MRKTKTVANKQTDRWTDKKMERRFITDGNLHKYIELQTDKQTDRRTDKKMERLHREIII